jgi:hypothetical protein
MKTKTKTQPKNAQERKEVTKATLPEMVSNANAMGSLSLGDDLAKHLTGPQMSKDTFWRLATAIPVEINGQLCLADVKDFNSGNWGWYLNGQVFLAVTGAATRENWESTQPMLKVTLNGQEKVMEPKVFSSGTVGWYLGDKWNTKVGEQIVRCQVSFGVYVVKSKETDGWKDRVKCQVGCSLTIIGSKNASENARG